MKKLLLSGLIGLSVIVVAGLLYWGYNSPALSTSATTDIKPTVAVSSASNVTSKPQQLSTNKPTANHKTTSFHTGLEHLPFSLHGTDVDGKFQVDADGHLRVTNSARHVFDYFLSAMGEESLDTIKQRIDAYIQNQLQPPASDEAKQLLTNYLAYKQALGNIQSAPQAKDGELNVQGLRQQMNEVAALRGQYLDAQAVQAFFGDQHTYDQYTLNRLQIMQNKQLTDDERTQQLNALKQQLPAKLRAENKEVSGYQGLRKVDQACQKEDCTKEQLYQARAKVVGDKAASRLAKLDQQNKQWKKQLNQWFSQRQTILNNANLSADDKQSQLDQLRGRLFDSAQQKRVKALSRLHDNNAK